MKTYYAKSTFISKTFLFNAVSIAAALLTAVLEAQEIINVLPEGTMKYFVATVSFVNIVNIVLRQYTVRPVALMAPGETKAVKVEALPKGT